MQLNAWGTPPETIRNHSVDSLRWNMVELKRGDVIVDSWAKSGTTWLQQVASQLLYGVGGRHVLPKVSPWIESLHVPERRILDMCRPDRSGPRLFKSHLSARALPYGNSAKYIYIARDGREAVWSWYQHHRRLRPIVYSTMAAAQTGVAPMPPPDPDYRIYFREWIAKDGYPLWPFWSHIRSWWDLRNHSNVLIVHYEQVRRSPRQLISRIARFLEVPLPSADLEQVVQLSSKEYMARNVALISPDISLAIRGGGQNFFAGVQQGWRDVLTDEDISLYENTVVSKLGSSIANWLEEGHDLD